MKSRKTIMKKIKFLALAFAAMFIVACSSNPAIDAAEDFIDNPTAENKKAVEEAEEKLNDEEKKEYEKWSKEHAAELAAAALACGNPAINAAEDFIDNPTEENAKAVKEAEEKLNDEEKKEYEKWCEEHAAEIAGAFFKSMM